jgi:hypothetical protein
MEPGIAEPGYPHSRLFLVSHCGNGAVVVRAHDNRTTTSVSGKEYRLKKEPRFNEPGLLVVPVLPVFSATAEANSHSNGNELFIRTITEDSVETSLDKEPCRAGLEVEPGARVESEIGD